ncbi:MAG: tetratricopeptide repeat protein [Chloroflexi bacterium]|nr:tetratricopeptide repeat protein [Chloroflexota bacterium]
MLKQATIYFKLGGHYLDRGDLDPAINAFTRVIELEPDNARAYDRRGIAYGRKYYYDEAIRDFDQAIRIDPTYAGAYNNRGLSYYKLSRFAEALADYDRAIELSSDIGVFYANRGLAHHHRGEFDRAIADYSRAIELDPVAAEAYAYRGETYAQMGKYREALADFDRALDLDPGNIDAFASRTVIMGLSNQEETMKNPPEWHEGSVDAEKEHIRLFWKENTSPLALVAPAGKGSFVVQFLPVPQSLAGEKDAAVRGVRKELDFYLVGKGEKDPWAYARYHCGTAANLYSDVHWGRFPGKKAA